MFVPSKEPINTIKDENGQTFIEFIFLLLVLISMSFILIKGLNGYSGLRWRALIANITESSINDMQLR